MLRSALSRLPALLAAYVIAIQAVLLPVAVIAAAPFGGAECHSASSSSGGDGSGCPCAAACGILCCTQALAAAPQSEFAPVRHAVIAFRASVARDVVIISPDGRPQVARAPPAT